MSEPRRIAPAAEFDGAGGLIENLTAPKGPFQSKQSLLMFAAAVGIYMKRREPVRKRGEGIRWAVFQNSQDSEFVSALALAVTLSIQCLSTDTAEDQSRETIFEEHAAGGMKYLESVTLAVPGDALDLLLGLVTDARTDTTEIPPALEGLASEDIELLGA